MDQVVTHGVWVGVKVTKECGKELSEVMEVVGMAKVTIRVFDIVKLMLKLIILKQKLKIITTELLKISIFLAF